MDELNLCRRLGYLVSASHWLPSDPGEFCVPGAVWVVGCNQLVCTDCGVRVRNREGIFGGEDCGRHAKTYATDDWTTLKYLSHKKSWAGHRFYSCKCESHTEDGECPLDNSEDEWPVPAWKCAGHPRAVVGERYYGVEVVADLDWVRLVDRAFRGWKPDEVWSETTIPWQALWLRGLYRRLLGTPMAGQLSNAVAEFLTHSEDMMRALALRFFYGQPGSPGGERLAELVKGDRRLFAGVKNPFPTDEPDLEAWLLGALGQRLELGKVQGDGQRKAADRDELIRIARAEAVKPGKALPLMSGLLRADMEWVVANAPEIAMGTPAAAGEILTELDAEGEDIHLLAGRIASMPGFDVAGLRKVVKERFEDMTRAKTLAALSKAVRGRK